MGKTLLARRGDDLRVPVRADSPLEDLAAARGAREDTAEATVDRWPERPGGRLAGATLRTLGRVGKRVTP